MVEQVLSSVAGLVRVGRADESIMTAAVDLCQQLLNNASQCVTCARAVASLAVQIVQRSHGVGVFLNGVCSFFKTVLIFCFLLN